MMLVGVLKSKFQSVTLSFLTSKLQFSAIHFSAFALNLNNVPSLYLFKLGTSRTLIHNAPVGRPQNGFQLRAVIGN